MCTEESPAVEVERHTHLQYTIFKTQLGLTMMNCSMLQLVLCSSQGSGCGFVVVAVLVCFLFSFLVISLQLVDRQVTVDCMDMTGGALQALSQKQDSVFGHPRCQFRSTVMPFELLLYHKLIFAFFGFAVCSSCQNRSLFLCIVSSVSVISNNRRTQDSAKNILNLLQQFSVHSGEGRRGLSVSFALLPD